MVCCCGDEGWIFSNGILNFVLNDYNMITCVLNDYKMITNFYFKCKSMWDITHSCLKHNLTICHVKFFKQVI